MREVTDHKIERHYSRFLWSKFEVSCTITKHIKLTCDVCGQAEEGDETDVIGVHTGKMTLKFYPRHIRESTFGFKEMPIAFCKTHTERQIEDAIRKIKDLEAV